MKLLGFLFVATMASALIVAAVRGRDVPDRVAFERGGALFSRVGATGKAEQLADSAHYEKIDRPGGQCFVLLQWDERRTWLKILDCQASGSVRTAQTISDDKLNDATAIDRAEFLPDGRLSVLLHVNPSCGVAVTFDPHSRETTFTMREWDDAIGNR